MPGSEHRITLDDAETLFRGRIILAELRRDSTALATPMRGADQSVGPSSEHIHL
jgi:hypothetical protein